MAKVDLDPAGALAEAKALNQAMDAAIGDIEVNIDVDSGAAVSKVAALSGVMGTLGGALGAVSDQISMCLTSVWAHSLP